MQIVRLIPQEVAMLDPNAVRLLALQEGTECAEEVICSTLEELGRHLRRLDDDYRSVEGDRLLARVKKIVALTDQVGMRHVARVAADVARCIGTGDEAALAATLSRLMRLMTRALDEAAESSAPF